MPTTHLPAEETWRLEDLFPDDASFERARRELETEVLPALARHAGGLFATPDALRMALDEIADASRRLRRLHCYAALGSDTDTRRSDHQARREQVGLLGTRFGECIAFVRPEILAEDPARVAELVRSDPRLAPHAHFLRDLVRQRAHVRSPGEERIIAESGLVSHEPATLYQLFTNAELPRPECVLSSGETIRLTPVAFQEHRTSRNRDDRKRVFAGYYSAYDGFRATLGQNLNGIVKSHLFHARVRGHGSCLESALFPDDVPPSVYRNLIRQVRRQLPLLHRYFSRKARTLGIESFEYADVPAELGQAPPRRYDPGEARTLLCEALAPLGPAYGAVLRDAFDGRWIDWHPGPGKRSGAYATGWGYDVHPYVLMNFTGTHESVRTLAHELGHAIHSHFSNAAQPYPTAEYSIFVAEVASTFNEALVLRHLLSRATTDDERRFLLGSWLDTVRGTLFRQAMFAEFELGIHERVERGLVLTGDALCGSYLELLRDYHGHASGVVRVGEEYAIEWAAIPHFYMGFYVYQYATGLVAALALCRAVVEGRPGALERYLGFLRSGGSDHPLALLRAAGVDLESGEPFAAAFDEVASHLDRLEAL